MNDDYAPRLDPGFAAWLAAMDRQVQRHLGQMFGHRSLVNSPVSLIQEAESYTKDAATISLEEAADLHAHFNLPYAR